MSRSTLIRNIIETRLLPWVLQDGVERFIVAQPRLKQMKTPAAVTLAPKKQKGPRKAMRGYIFNGTSAMWPNDELTETHTPMLTFVLCGQADLNCGDYILKMPERHAVFIPGDVPRWAGTESLKHLEDNPQRFADWIAFLENRGSLHIWLGHQRGNRSLPPEIDEKLMVHNVRLVQLLEDIQKEQTEQRFNNREICRRLLELFLLTLLRDLKEDLAVFSWELAAGEMMQGDDHNPISRAQQYIREHLHEHLTQDKVAHLVRLSRTQFIRRFREETGQTFNQYVTACRMEQAKVLLLNTNFPLTFIYLSLGYKSSVHFNALFRKTTGMLPREFRLQKETKNNGA